MSKNISTKELYHIINQSLSKCGNHSDNPVNEDIQKFYDMYWQAIKNNSQLDIFEEVPTLSEIRKSITFCNLLDKYRLSVDPYRKDNIFLTEKECKELSEYINYFSPHISKENEKRIQILTSYIRYHISDKRNEDTLKNYDERIKKIIKNKKENSDQAGKTPAEYLFYDLFHDEDFTSIPLSTEKILIYVKSIEAVNSLPNNKYSRTDKFKLKRDLNNFVIQCCETLGDKDSDVRKSAEQDIIKFQKAMENARHHKEKTSIDLRNKRLQDEYWFK